MIDTEQLIHDVKQIGAHNAGVTAVGKIPFERELRKACEANHCGHYGKNWTCPPSVGDIDDLIAEAKGYETALVYQTVSGLEDSFDYEGMVAALKKHVRITDKITEYIKKRVTDPVLQLSAGGCPICERCAKIDEQPCRYPDRALASLEAYGIYVAKLAELCDINYINGKNTVTYFGAYLFGKQ